MWACRNMACRQSREDCIQKEVIINFITCCSTHDERHTTTSKGGTARTCHLEMPRRILATMAPASGPRNESSMESRLTVLLRLGEPLFGLGGLPTVLLPKFWYAGFRGGHFAAASRCKSQCRQGEGWKGLGGGGVVNNIVSH